MRWLLRNIADSKTPKTFADSYIVEVRKHRGDLADVLLRHTRKAWSAGMRGEEPIEAAFIEFHKIID